MAVMVTLAIALALVIMASTFVVARRLWHTAKRLQADVERVTERLAPLQAELAEELQITAAETEQLQSSLQELRSSRVR